MPDAYQTYYKLAQALALANKPDLAIEALNTAILNNPGYGDMVANEKAFDVIRGQANGLLRDMVGNQKKLVVKDLSIKIKRRDQLTALIKQIELSDEFDSSIELNPDIEKRISNIESLLRKKSYSDSLQAKGICDSLTTMIDAEFREIRNLAITAIEKVDSNIQTSKREAMKEIAELEETKKRAVKRYFPVTLIALLIYYDVSFSNDKDYFGLILGFISSFIPYLNYFIVILTVGAMLYFKAWGVCVIVPAVFGAFYWYFNSMKKYKMVVVEIQETKKQLIQNILDDIKNTEVAQ